MADVLPGLAALPASFVPVLPVLVASLVYHTHEPFARSSSRRWLHQKNTTERDQLFAKFNKGYSNF
jgi:hypothetical protein